MPPMKGKIKNLFSFLRRAWSGGFHGKMGIALAAFACFMFIGLFNGTVSIQRFAINTWRLNQEQIKLDSEKQTLTEIQQNITLLQNYSPDYVDELGLKYLNIGDPKIRILKY